MFNDGRFEIEKNRSNWRLTVTGLPALGISIGIGVVIALVIVSWLTKHPMT